VSCMSEYMCACARVCLSGAQINVNSLGALSYVAVVLLDLSRWLQNSSRH